MHFEKINEKIIWTREGRGNSTAIDLGNKVVVVDAMIGPKPAQEWRKVVEKELSKEVTILVLTHHHFDHVGGTQAFEDSTVISSTDSIELIRDSYETNWNTETLEQKLKESQELINYGLDKFKPTYPSISFEKEITIYGEEELKITQVDGHAKGSAYLWLPESKILVTGDLFFHKMFPYASDPSVDPIAWQSAMKEMIALKPEKIIPGHGKLAEVEDLKEKSRFIDDMINVIKEKLQEGIRPEQMVVEEMPDYYSEERREWRKQMINSWAKLFDQK
ncbi:MAG: MBL fold metallo-hydrolase [Candidatus Kariarchaeaceae archaeon]